jgi:hypothetical protein
MLLPRSVRGSAAIAIYCPFLAKARDDFCRAKNAHCLTRTAQRNTRFPAKMLA